MLSLSDPDIVRDAAFVDGAWLEAPELPRCAVQDPATGEALAHVPRFDVAATRAAIGAAERAFVDWRRTTAKHRAGVLRRWFDLVIGQREDLATLITREGGKPLAEARAEVDYAASFLEWFGEEAKRTYGEIVPPTRDGQQILVLREPVGVCAAITPWNFPAAMIARKVAPALAAGCTVVAKPAEQTPLTALALAALGQRAGLPAGAFNVITGGAEDAPRIGLELTSHPGVRKVSFTGSTAVGKAVLAQSASTIKRCSLELGGNAPFLVFASADVDAAVSGLLVAKFRNAGQTCIAANRVLVEDAVYDAFAERLAERVSALVVGPGLEPSSQIGPLIDGAALAKVEEHVADAVARGARLLVGGARHARGGHYFQPTVLLDATPEMRLAQEETFGPVAALIRFSREDEAVAIANRTEAGLAAYLYTRDRRQMDDVARALEVGMVGVNCGAISNEVAPFGGVKQSGIGREGSRHGIDEYLELKYLSIG